LKCTAAKPSNASFQWLLPALKAMGYDSVYAEKTREAMGAEGTVDGCALCWRSDKLFLRDSRVVSFNAKAMQLEEQLPKSASSASLRDFLL
jgi:mRNA deadenylase 3'-5' endonuclease subunit Ccr4